MALFENCSVLLELKYLSYKEKKKLRSAVTDNGGNVVFVVNKQCSLVVTSDVANLSSNRLRSVHKHQIPVVGVDYVYSCVERGVRLPVDEFKLDTSSASSLPLLPPPFSSPRKTPHPRQVSVIKVVDETSLRNEAPQKSGNVLEKLRIYSEADSRLPSFPNRFQVAKYSIYKKRNSSSWFVLELQSSTRENGRQYRVVRYLKEDAGAEKAAVRDMLVFPSTSEEAVEVYQALRDSLEAAGLQIRTHVPPETKDLGSAPLKELLLEEKLKAGRLSEEVSVFVELLWTEALGCLGDVLSVPIDKLSLNDVSRVEGLLLQAQKKLRENDYETAVSLLGEVYTLLPHKMKVLRPDAKLISQKLDLCQLIRDLLNVSEMTLRNSMTSCVGKYRALRCSIEPVPSGSSEFKAVSDLLQNSKVQIQQIMRVSRGVELQTFKSELGNIKPLLHSSSPTNFVGILSRGLLLPRVGVELHGIERTDVGNLGSGIYFSDAMSTSLKYSKPSVMDGSRLLLVCDVALGRCRDVRQRDATLTQPPEGHHSMHGVRHTANARSDFEDDEYVVYSTDQVKLKYVVQFSIEGDLRKDFSPDITKTDELCLPPSGQDFGSEDDGVEHVTNPLDNVKPGLLNSSGQQLPLQAVHVKCKLMDLLSQVIIFQKYTNQSSEAIEAKYVFPLDDSAAVCGFEAFINGKHVVGQVKEKETARKEYKQAIEKGHGAYLMDQDAPDVFTISVGNLPPGATVLIKITYVSELMVRDGSILFSLPGSVAPWQESAALNQTTQVTVEKVCVTDEEAGSREFTLNASVEMPYEISSLQCITHKVKMKRTDCKAVVSVLPGEVLGPDGFQLNITLSEVHLPRMWVENHPDKDSQACMLVFYPNFEVDSGSAADEVVLLLDTSESMRGESLHMAQRIALQVLKVLNNSVRLNFILFGTEHREAFLTAKPLSEVHQTAERFIKFCSSVGGSTELWRPLRALSLLPPSHGVRNLLLLSDGHIQNAELTLQLLRDNSQHSRLFSCGLSPTANRHMLRALAQAGGGAYEFFDTKTKHNWAEKVARQVKRMASPGCSSVSVKWQQFNPTAPLPVQAPKKLHALFNDCHTLVYGFVPHCTQATLVGNLSGQELRTMVSTSEMQKTRGKFLHKLTARALIRDYEDGNLDNSEAGHERKKAELKSFIVELSKEFSILSQFTSFVAIEERDSEQAEDNFTDIPKLIAEEDVDFLSYMSFPGDDDSDPDMGFGAFSDGIPEACRVRFSPENEVVGDDEYENLCEDVYANLRDDVYEEDWYDDVCEALGEDDALVAKASRRYDSESEEGSSEDDYSSPPSDVEGSRDDVYVLPPAGMMLCLGASSDEVAEELYDGARPRTVCMAGRRGGLRTLQLQGLSSLSSSQSQDPCPRSLPPPPPPPCGPTMGLGPAPPPPPPPPCGPTMGPAPAPPPPRGPTMRAAPPPPPPPCGPTMDLGPCKPPPPPHLRFGLPPSPPPPLPGAPSLPPESMLLSLRELSKSFAPPVFEPQSRAKIPQYGSSSSSSKCFNDSLRLGPAAMPQMDVEPSNAAKDSYQGFPFSAAPGAFFPSPVWSETQSGFLGRPIVKSKPLAAAEVPLLLGASVPVPLSRSSSAAPAAAPPSLVWGETQSGFLGRPIVKSKPLAAAEVPLLLGASVPVPLSRSSSTVPAAVPLSMDGFTFGGPFGGSMPLFGASALPQTEDESPLSVSVIREMSTLSRSADEDALPDPYCGQARQPLLDEPTEFQRHSLGGLKQRPDESEAHVEKAQSLKRIYGKAARWESVGVRPRMFRGPQPTLNRKWIRIFQMQHSEGYWELTEELGELIDVNVDIFVNVFLKNKGIRSLGAKAHADILRLVATLLVLQLMRLEKLDEGKLLGSLFRLEHSEPRPQRWQRVKTAVDWVCWADRQYPSIYSRLEFGQSWESATRQLLGYEDLPHFSPLNGLGLHSSTYMLAVH